MTAPRTLAYFAAKGGQGTTVAAACVALMHARAGYPTLLIDAADHHDAFAVLGLPEPAEPDAVATVTTDLDLVAVETVAELGALDTAGYDIVVIDAGQHRPTAGTATLVTRPCYLALRRALTVTPPPDNAIVIREPGRALGCDDVTAILGIPVIATIPTDAAIARTVDAGLLAARIPAPLLRHQRELVLAPARSVT